MFPFIVAHWAHYEVDADVHAFQIDIIVHMHMHTCDTWHICEELHILTGALKSRDLTTRHHVPFADFAFQVCYTLMSRKTTELYVKVFQRVQQLVPQFARTCAMADFEEASVAGFFLDNRLCQITVQTFSIIIATFPSADTYLCCWRC